MEYRDLPQAGDRVRSVRRTGRPPRPPGRVRGFIARLFIVAVLIPAFLVLTVVPGGLVLVALGALGVDVGHLNGFILGILVVGGALLLETPFRAAVEKVSMWGLQKPGPW